MGSVVSSVLAHVDAWIVHSDRPQWLDITAADFAGMRRKVVLEGRRILDRTAMEGVELHVLGG